MLIQPSPDRGGKRCAGGGQQLRIDVRGLRKAGVTYRALLGDRFDGRVLSGEFANPNPPPFFRDVVGGPHSVVTAHLVDQAGHPTLQARDEILRFLAERL